MPLIPYITDTGDQLDLYFKTFSEVPVDYVMPATLTLYGTARADSKPMMMRAIHKHFPELVPKYNKLFRESGSLPFYYRNAFQKKMNALQDKYQVASRIIQ